MYEYVDVYAQERVWACARARARVHRVSAYKQRTASRGRPPKLNAQRRSQRSVHKSAREITSSSRRRGTSSGTCFASLRPSSAARFDVPT
eukprot:606952-Pleurochrysis_carterae.AAC.1